MQPECPDVIVYVCCNCLPRGGHLPRQWEQDGLHIVVHEVPCSGKMDGRYLMHAFEGGGCGLCVVTCPKGECHLSQGNYRAEIRISTVQRLLSEVGLEPQRAELLRFSPEDPVDRLEQLVREAVGRVSAAGKSPICVE
jgi:F420-non-reducing hydrogenase iron-sulfur subunit